jgi:hypothetical protein
MTHKMKCYKQKTHIYIHTHRQKNNSKKKIIKRGKRQPTIMTHNMKCYKQKKRIYIYIYIYTKKKKKKDAPKSANAGLRHISTCSSMLSFRNSSHESMEA